MAAAITRIVKSSPVFYISALMWDSRFSFRRADTFLVPSFTFMRYSLSFSFVVPRLGALSNDLPFLLFLFSFFFVSTTLSTKRTNGIRTNKVRLRVYSRGSPTGVF